MQMHPLLLEHVLGPKLSEPVLLSRVTSGVADVHQVVLPQSA